MRRKVMLKEVISVVKLSLFPIWCWPLSKDATKFKVFCMNLYHYLCIIVAICLGIPSLYGATNHLDKPDILANQLLMSSSMAHVISNFIFHKINYHHLQNVTYEIEHFCNLMKPREEIVIQRYIDKCIRFYSTSMFIFYFFTLVTIVVLPPIMHQPFPTLAEYPFDVLQQPLRTIIFMQQSMAGIITAAQLCQNTFMALLLWFASARFEILIEELRDVTDVYQLFKCIKKHQELLKYAAEVGLAVRPFAFITICCSTVSLIIIFLLFVTHQPAVLLFQFTGLGLACLSEVFMYAWPGEYLMYTSKNVALAAFNAFKYDQPVKIWKYFRIIIMRSQKPITVAIPCLMPALSFNFFTSYCSTVLSYFTTLRAMMNSENT